LSARLRATAMKKHVGFTLIELMIVVTVVGILAAIAYPSYSRYIVKSRRSDAQIALLQAAATQEKFFSDCGYYAVILPGTKNCSTSADGVLGISTSSLNQYYTLSVAAGVITASSCSAISCGFTINATPNPGPQSADGPLRIDAVGMRQWNKNGAGTWISWTSN